MNRNRSFVHRYPQYYGVIAIKGGRNANRMSVMVTNGLAYNSASCGMGDGVEGGSPVESGQKRSPGLVYMSVYI